MPRLQFTRRLQKGFSLVEVLVALVVLSVGMLGIAGLYVITLRSGGSAIARTQAVSLANDIADRIRANRLATTAYNTPGTPVNNSCVGGTVNCTRAQMAAEDLWQWNQQIQAALPGSPSGSIVVVQGAPVNANNMRTPSRYTITVSWSDIDATTLSHVVVIEV
ncbi:MAG TPA: type IV pilus modification protein PilV [Steroidobacteraceae bacterium]|nr:type IV pilus modification protein PilV [Steroidobacteraceae bacterium]